jgi:hypothetical protein
MRNGNPETETLGGSLAVCAYSLLAYQTRLRFQHSHAIRIASQMPHTTLLLTGCFWSTQPHPFQATQPHASWTPAHVMESPERGAGALNTSLAVTTHHSQPSLCRAPLKHYMSSPSFSILYLLGNSPGLDPRLSHHRAEGDAMSSPNLKPLLVGQFMDVHDITMPGTPLATPAC